MTQERLNKIEMNKQTAMAKLIKEIKLRVQMSVFMVMNNNCQVDSEKNTNIIMVTDIDDDYDIIKKH